MHHWEGPDGTGFNFNSDLSGEVEVIANGNVPLLVEVPAADLLAFADHVRQSERAIRGLSDAQSAAEETIVTVSRRTLEEGLTGDDLTRNFAEWVGVLQREIESGEGVQDGTLMLVGGACISMLREMQVGKPAVCPVCDKPVTESDPICPHYQ